jgi:hypothetical protein
VLSSPDRPRDDRRLLALALLLSLVVHLTAGGFVAGFAHRLSVAIAKLMPQPKPTPEEVAATSDVVTIERRPVPPHVVRQPKPAPRPAQRVAQAAPPRAVPKPTAAPTVGPTTAPTQAPTTAPTLPPVKRHVPATVHRPPPTRVAQATVPHASPQQAERATNALSAQQIAALSEQFSKTIAQTHASLTDTPKQPRPPSTMKHYDLVMAGTLNDVRSAQGECRAVETRHDGPYVWHIEDCDFLYQDGYHEHVTIPWWQRYLASDDPENHPGKLYEVQPPPANSPPPNPLNFSRLVCTFYHNACESLLQRERAAGGGPAAGD